MTWASSGLGISEITISNLRRLQREGREESAYLVSDVWLTQLSGCEIGS